MVLREKNPLFFKIQKEYFFNGKGFWYFAEIMNVLTVKETYHFHFEGPIFFKKIPRKYLNWSIATFLILPYRSKSNPPLPIGLEVRVVTRSLLRLDAKY